MSASASPGISTALTGAMLVADPEMTVPVLAITHPKKSIGLVLLMWAISLVVIGSLFYMVGFTRGIGKLFLGMALLVGLASGYMLFSKPHKLA